MCRDASVAIYRTQVDKMVLLQSSKADEDTIWDAYASTTSDSGADKVMTAVLFRGNIRSQPRVIRNSDGLAMSTGAIVRLKEGAIEYLQWRDIGCKDCGDDGFCMEDQTCASTYAACTCEQFKGGAGDQRSNVICTEAQNQRCLLSIHLGFSGTDANSEVMSSGDMVRKISQFSVSELYTDATEQLSDIKDQFSSWDAS